MSFNTTSLITTNKTPTDLWVRPSDWPNTNEADGEIIYLVSDIGLTASVSFSLTTNFTRSATQNLYIEWGDSVTNTVSLTGATISAVTYHNYSVGTGTPCSLGYTTWKIRIYTDAGCTITGAKLNTNPYVADVPPSGFFYTIVPVLEAKFGSGVLEGSPINYSVAPAERYTYLEYVKFPSTWLGTSLNSAYRLATNLKRVDFPISAPNLTDMTNCFFNCSNLRGDIILPADAPISLASSMFNGCFLISSFTWLGGNSCTGINSAFNACYNLIRVKFGSMLVCLSWANTFFGCFNLQFVDIQALNSSGSTITFSQMFQGCASLEYLVLPPINPNPGTTVSLNAMFASCFSLKTMTITISLSCFISIATSVFQNCYQLKSGYIYGVNRPGSPSFSDMAQMFQNCYVLENFVLPSGGSYDALNMFNSCYSLKTINLSGFESCLGFQNAFTNCTSLTSLTFPSGTMSTTTLSAAFSNCPRLTDLNLSNFRAISSLSSTFLNCSNLKSIILPSTMNSCTTMLSAFSGCYNLTSVTLPTSMSLCNSFQNVFLNCYSIRTIVMPATVAATTTNFQSAFNNCTALESITLPTTQTTSLTTCNSAFLACSSLKEIKNLNKLGSNLTSGPLVTFLSNNYTPSILGLSFSCRMGSFDFSSLVNIKSKLASIRLLNTGTAQWTGTSPQINISYTNLAYVDLVQLFNDIAAQGTVTTKTINITGCTGAASLIAADRLILTSRGWTITG